MVINNPNIGLLDFPDRSLPFPSTEVWELPGWSWRQGAVGQAAIAGRLVYIPIFVARNTTYDRIGLWVTAGDAAGGVCELRIYNWEDGIPTTQILAPGTVSTNAGGAKEIIISLYLARGSYCLATRCDQTPGLAGINLGEEFTAPVRSMLNSVLLTAGAWNNVLTFVTGVMADPATTPTAVTDPRFATVRLRRST